MAQQCAATAKSTGERCDRKAIEGGVTCTVHGSSTKAAKAAAARRIERAEAERFVATFGLRTDILPGEALLEQVQWIHGHVVWLRGMVQALDAERLTGGVARKTEKVGDSGVETTETWEARPSVWHTLYAEWSDRLTAVCSAALKAGVEERRVRVAEQQGELLAQVIKGILTDLDLTADQQARVSEVVPRHLRLVMGGAA